MENRFLVDIIDYLRQNRGPTRLRTLRLTRFFTVVELEDGSVGACASYYYTLADTVLDQLEQILAGECRNPFSVTDMGTLRQALHGVADPRQLDLVIASVMCTIASALSAPIIRHNGDQWFDVRQHRPLNWTDGVESALVVGFGGYLEPLVDEGTVKRVHVVDLVYDLKPEFAAQVARWAEQHSGRTITGSTGVQHSHLRTFDLISITGSALCNDTMEYFLSNVRTDATIIVQGQSGSVHPKRLFEAGVTWVATTLKPLSLARLDFNGHDGNEMRSMLQGGLPWIYLTPRETGRAL